MFTHVPVVRTGSGALITCVGTLKIPCASKSCPMCPFRTQRALSREGNLYSKILCREWLFTSHCNKNLISSVSLQPSVTACLVWQLKYNENLISFFFFNISFKRKKSNNFKLTEWFAGEGSGYKDKLSTYLYYLWPIRETRVLGSWKLGMRLDKSWVLNRLRKQNKTLARDNF